MACPICSKPTHDDWRPFCSERCKNVDLAKWFGGGYAIPATSPEDLDEAEDALNNLPDDREPRH